MTLPGQMTGSLRDRPAIALACRGQAPGRDQGPSQAPGQQPDQQPDQGRGQGRDQLPTGPV